MAYTITRSNGNTITVADNSLDSTYSITLVGKNRTNYGTAQNQNFFRLMEHFASNTEPSNAQPGQIWWDTGVGILKVHSGAGWKPVSSIQTATVAPSNASLGDLWFDTTNQQLKVWSGSVWFVIGPTGTSFSGITGFVTENVPSTSYYVASMFASNVRVAVLSANSTATSWTGFSTLGVGLNFNTSYFSSNIGSWNGNVLGNAAWFNTFSANSLSVTSNLGVGTSSPTYQFQTTNTARIAGTDISNSTIEINSGGTGSRWAIVDFHGDDTYTDYALRVARANTGINASSDISHRGTGNLNITAEDAAPIQLKTTNSTRMTVTGAGDVGIGTVAPTQKLDVSGNIRASNVVATSNVSAVNVTITGLATIGSNANVKITGGNSGEFLRTDGTGNLSWAAAAGGAGSGTVSSGTASRLTYYAASGTTVVDTGANLTWSGTTLTVVGTANATRFESTTLSTTGNANVGNIGASTVVAATVTASGNVSGSNIIASTSVATPLVTTTQLTATGNATFTGASINLGNVSNIRISGGTNGYVLTSDGANNVSWQASSGGGSGSGTVNSGTATQLAYYATTGNAVSSSGTAFTWSATSRTLTVGLIGSAATLNIVGSTAQTGTITATNIAASGGNVSATGNVTGANLVASAALIGATASITGTATVGNVSTTGNVAAGNASITGRLVTTGNVGIGVASPAYPLDVAGVIRSQSGTVFTLVNANATGGYYGTTSAHPVVILSSNTERVRVLSTGNVGIGNSAPAHTLSVTGNAYISSSLTVPGTGNIDTLLVSSATAATNTTSGALQVVGGTGIGGNLHVGGTITGSGAGLTSIPGSALGSVYLGTTSVLLSRTSGALSLAGVSIDGSSGTAANLSSTTANIQLGSLGVGIAAPSATQGMIKATNDIIAYASSDKRLKENIVVITSSLDKVCSLNGVEFDWTDEFIANSGGEDGYFVRKHDVGVIAQEVQEVLPEVVAERADGYLAVKYEKMIALLIESIKELRAEIQELKSK